MPVTRKGSLALSVLLAFSFAAFVPANAMTDTITLSGAFTRDDDVQLFDVVIASTGSVDFRSFGYGGGTTPAGQTIAAGGFDTALTLFSGAGVFITDNDDGAGAAVDPSTGMPGDARITANLTPGQYILALTQYDNFALTPNLSDGFVESGNRNFTADSSFTPGPPCASGLFRDISGSAGQCRTGNETVSFANVASATARPISAVPEPWAGWLLGAALSFLVPGVRRKRK